MTLNRIIVLIEKLRKDIHTLAQKKGLKNEEILQKSCELDTLLIKYYKLLKRTSVKPKHKKRR